jgi:hypothetical protein
MSDVQAAPEAVDHSIASQEPAAITDHPISAPDTAPVPVAEPVPVPPPAVPVPGLDGHFLHDELVQLRFSIKSGVTDGLTHIESLIAHIAARL